MPHRPSRIARCSSCVVAARSSAGRGAGFRVHLAPILHGTPHPMQAPHATTHDIQAFFTCAMRLSFDDTASRAPRSARDRCRRMEASSSACGSEKSGNSCAGSLLPSMTSAPGPAGRSRRFARRALCCRRQSGALCRWVLDYCAARDPAGVEEQRCAAQVGRQVLVYAGRTAATRVTARRLAAPASW